MPNGDDDAEFEQQLEALSSQIESAKKDVDKKKEISAAEFEQKKRSQDRSFIANTIVVLFFICCVAVIVYLIVVTFVGSDVAAGGMAPDAASGRMIDLLSSIVLPVVTLVIGYYFGKETRAGAVSDDDAPE